MKMIIKLSFLLSKGMKYFPIIAGPTVLTLRTFIKLSAFKSLMLFSGPKSSLCNIPLATIISSIEDLLPIFGLCLGLVFTMENHED